MRPEQIVEALLFASDAPLRADEIARADESLDEDVVDEAVALLQRQYQESERAFDIVELAEGYQVLTRSEFAGYLERFDTVPRSTRLSGPALETLAIVAYRQPIGRLEVEHVRGVGSSGVIRTLQDRGLVEVVGRAEGMGRPLLYGTTMRFLEHFGFHSLEDLPRPEELPIVLRDRSVPVIPDEDEDGEGPVEDSASARESAHRPADGEAEGTRESADGGSDAEGTGAEGTPEPPEAASDHESAAVPRGDGG